VATVTHDGREEWVAGLEAALAALGSGRVEKVVLARQIEVALSSPIDLVEVLTRLVTDQPSTYCFLIDGLVGASPELLVSLNDGMVRSTVLAGTAADPGALTGERIELEHELAARSVAAGLGWHTTGLLGERSVVSVGEISHLATSYQAVAHPGTGVLDILATLHPTAAVAGAPTDAALGLIREIEPRPRGRYAGPVGWFDSRGNGCFALALRCGLVTEETVTLYAGGGLVAGSVMEAEWLETEAKLGPMLRALGVVSDKG
jgi:menaquinone-specific isochorismate synthase